MRWEESISISSWFQFGRQTSEKLRSLREYKYSTRNNLVVPDPVTLIICNRKMWNCRSLCSVNCDCLWRTPTPVDVDHVWPLVRSAVYSWPMNQTLNKQSSTKVHNLTLHQQMSRGLKKTCQICVGFNIDLDNKYCSSQKLLNKPVSKPWAEIASSRAPQ